MFFHYTALNPDNKRLSGVIEADAQSYAEQKLNELGYSIVDLKLMSGEIPITPGMTRFLFTALDKKNKKVNGTVESESLESAFQRLSDEYELEVTSLLPKDIPAEEQQKILMKLAFLKEQAEKKGKGKQGEDIKRQREEERKELLELVTKTMQTVQTFLQQYEVDMKKDEKDMIRSYLDQLARIKDSTNLEHIRKTSEHMLEHIREKEIFLSERRKENLEMQIKIEAKTLLFDIQHTGLKTEIDILSIAEKMTALPNPWGRIAAPLGKAVLRLYGADDPEIRQTYRDLKKIRKKFFELIRLGYFSRSSAIRNEAKNEIRKILAEKKRLKFQLQTLKTKRKLESLGKGISLPGLSVFSLVTGWLLVFYLVFYFLAFPFVFYKTGGISLPQTLNLYRQPLLPALIVLFFLFHIALELKKNFLPRHFLSTLILAPLTTILYLFFVFNFVF